MGPVHGTETRCSWRPAIAALCSIAGLVGSVDGLWGQLIFRSWTGGSISEAVACGRRSREKRRRTRDCRHYLRRESQRLWSSGLSSLADYSFPPGAHRPAGADLVVLRDCQQCPADLYRWPRSPAAGGSLSPLLRRLHWFLGRPEAGHPHQSAHETLHAPEPARAERANGDSGDLGEDRSANNRSESLDL